MARSFPCFRPLTLLVWAVLCGQGGLVPAGELTRLKYNNPGLVVDLGVGLWAWPLPMDYDGDGDLDLLVSCPDKPCHGVYFFENPGGSKTPVFRPGIKLCETVIDLSLSNVGGQPRLLAPGKEFLDPRQHQLGSVSAIPVPLRVDPQFKKLRDQFWKYVDFDGDGLLDLCIAQGVWDEYGWDDAFNDQGQWTNGPLHGYVYIVRNEGSNQSPRYAEPWQLWTGTTPLRRIEEIHSRPHLPRPFTPDGELDAAVAASDCPVDVYGRPSPNFADFDGDGDLDLLCGEFLDGFTYFENRGTRTAPQYAAPRRLVHGGQKLTLDLEMVVPTAVDWDGDSDQDLIVGDEDGRVALVEHTGVVSDGLPRFLPPVYFQQVADEVKFGALSTPWAADWDGDGDEDLICGNTAGHIAFIENLDGRDSPRWAAPQKLSADGQEIRIQAGRNLSIQGPCEAKWGYTAPSVADLDGDGDLDLLTNSIIGRADWFENIGTRTQPKLAAGRPVAVAWSSAPPKPAWNWWNPAPQELCPQWRTTISPVPHGVLTGGRTERTTATSTLPATQQSPPTGPDLVIQDHEGFLALCEWGRDAQGRPVLAPPQRLFQLMTAAGVAEPFRLNPGTAGKSGRRHMVFTDWDADGDLDMLLNGTNATFFENIGVTGQPGGAKVQLVDRGPVDSLPLASHATCPTPVDFDHNGRPDLVLGAEDGYLYYKKNPLLAVNDNGPVAATAAPADNPALTEMVGRSALNAGPPSPVLDVEFVYETAPFRSCHASTIVETPQGLATAWFGGTDEGEPDVGIWFSRRVNGQWTAPVEVANGVQHTTRRWPCWNPVLFRTPRGVLQLYYKVGPSPSTWWGMLLESSDDGATWGVARRLPEQIDGPVRNKPILLADGVLLCGSSTEYAGWTLHFERTRDFGLTWERVGPIHTPEVFNAIQPTLLQHKDGTIQALCRTREMVVVSAVSKDGGLSWTKPEQTVLPNPNSGIDAVTLADGRHVLVYNHTRRNTGDPRGRALLNVAISDDGTAWFAALLLEHEPKGEFSYPACIQTSDGLLHITYTWHRKKIRHVVVDPRKLKPTPLVAGRWPGLPQAGAE